MGQYWLNGIEVTKEEYENSYVAKEEVTETTITDKSKVKRKLSKLSKIKLYVFLFVLVLLLIITLYLTNSAIAESNDIVQLYQSLSDKTTKSKDDFNKKMVFITVDSNGEVTVKVEHKDDLVEPGEESSNDSGSELVIDIPADAQLVANKLKDKYPEKAEAMGLAYSIIEPRLGANAAIGLMANIKHEGNFGLLEGMWWVSSPTERKSTYLSCCGKYTREYWNVSHEVHRIGGERGKILESTSEINTLLDLGGSTGIGVGIIQWSGGRRLALLNIYKNLLGSATRIDRSIAIAAEVQMMSDELSEGKSHYRGVTAAISKCGNTSPEAWAEAFCDAYEMPGASCVGTHIEGYTGDERMQYIMNPSCVPTSKDWQCRERAKTAKEIAEVLGGS